MNYKKITKLFNMTFSIVLLAFNAGLLYIVANCIIDNNAAGVGLIILFIISATFQYVVYGEEAVK